MILTNVHSYQDKTTMRFRLHLHAKMICRLAKQIPDIVTRHAPGNAGDRFVIVTEVGTEDIPNLLYRYPWVVKAL